MELRAWSRERPSKLGPSRWRVQVVLGGFWPRERGCFGGFVIFFELFEIFGLGSLLTRLVCFGWAD
jgi:hypothetical protein